MSNARKTTSAIMELMDNEMLDPRVIADMCLNWLSEADVHEMAQRNDLMPFIRAMAVLED